MGTTTPYHECHGFARRLQVLYPPPPPKKKRSILRVQEGVSESPGLNVLWMALEAQAFPRSQCLRLVGFRDLGLQDSGFGASSPHLKVPESAVVLGPKRVKQ